MAVQGATDWLTYLSCRAGRVTSQGGQDGVLQAIFDAIGVTNRFYVEFGFNCDTIDGGSGPNIAQLHARGWRGLLLDGAFSNPSINLHKRFLTSDNVCAVFSEFSVPYEPDYVSIDVDSTDLWLMRSVMAGYRPRVVTCEFNSSFGLEHAITHENAGGDWQGDRVYGASLRALVMAASEYAYTLVYVESFLDAFFIRDDVLALHSQVTAPALQQFARHCNLLVHRPCTSGRERLFIDYDCFRRTGGDVEQARAAAADIVRVAITQ